MTGGLVEVVWWRRCSIPGLGVVGVGARRPLVVALLLYKVVSPGISLTPNGIPFRGASLDPWSRGAIGNPGRVTTGTRASKGLGIGLSMGLVFLDPKILILVITPGMRARRTPDAGSVVLKLVLRIVTNLGVSGRVAVGYVAVGQVAVGVNTIGVHTVGLAAIGEVASLGVAAWARI